MAETNPIQPGTPGAGGFSKSFHFEMISDSARVDAALGAIQAYAAPDRVFVEAGSGSGVFAIAAARQYRLVFAIDKDPTMIEFAKWSAARCGVADKIRFIEADILDVTAADLGCRADVAFVEMLSIWGIEEPQVPVCRHISTSLIRPDGILIPQAIHNLVEGGRYDYWAGGVELKCALPAYSSRRPFNLNSVAACAATVKFPTRDGDAVTGRVRLRSLTSERLNSVRLSSIVEFAPGFNLYDTDTLMPRTIYPTNNEIRVSPGDMYTVSYQFVFGQVLRTAVFGLKTHPEDSVD